MNRLTHLVGVSVFAVGAQLAFGWPGCAMTIGLGLMFASLHFTEKL